MTENDLIAKLNSDLEQINQNLQELSDSRKIYSDYIETCQKVLNASDDVVNLNFFIEMNIDKMFKEFGYSNDDSLKNKMEMYQKFSMSRNYPITEEQKHDLASIFNDINEFLLQRIDNCIEMENELDIKSISIRNVINKLNSNTIDKECYDFLYQYLLNDTDNLENNFDLFMSLSLRFNDSINFEQNLIEEQNDEVIEEIEITNLELDRLCEIFSKYNYNFLDFSDEIIKGITPTIDNENVSPLKYILKLGKYDNIEEILNLLEKNNIKLDLNKYSNQLCLIFVLSNASNISFIINSIKEDINENTDYSFDELFKEFIKRPSFFISGTKYLGSNHNQVKQSPKKGDKNIILGVFYNYIKNRELFSSLGIDIVSSFIKCSSAFEKSHETVKKNIEMLELYGVDKEQYVKSLSCLGYDSYRIAFAFDRFIETGNIGKIQLGGYEHLKHNLSRIALKEEDLMNIIYRIINAANNGDTMEMIFNVTGTGIKEMSLCSQRLNTYPSDAIYINGVKQQLKSVDSTDPDVRKLDFENVVISLHENLLENYFVKKLEQFRENELYYNFNGVVISRNKVLRNINILFQNGMLNRRNTLFAITKDSILTKEQFIKISSCFWKLMDYNTFSIDGGYGR